MKKTGENFWIKSAKKFFFFYSALVIFYQFTFAIRIADFIMFLVILCCLRNSVGRKKLSLIPMKKEWWIFSVIVILSVIFSIDPLESLKMFTREYLRLAIMFWATILFLRTPEDLKHFIFVHLGANILLNLPAVFYLIDPTLLVHWGLADESMNRYVSYNQSYTRISFYYIFVLCFCFLYIVRKETSLKYRILGSIIFFINIWLLLLTKTRANVVAFGVSFLLMGALIYILPQRHFYRRSMTFLLVFIVLFGFLQPKNVQERIVSTYAEFKEGTYSFQDRFDFVYDMNWLLQKEIKIFGYGYSRRIYRVLPLFYPNINRRNFIHPHNQIYQWYLEHGLIGIVVFLWIGLQIIKQGFSLVKRGKEGIFFFIFICGIFVAFLVTGTVNHFFTRDTAKLFMILWGILNNSRKLIQ